MLNDMAISKFSPDDCEKQGGMGRICPLIFFGLLKRALEHQFFARMIPLPTAEKKKKNNNK